MTVISIILAIYIVLGCVFQSLSMLLLTVPVFYPAVQSMGFDLIWLGIIVLVVTKISLIMPSRRLECICAQRRAQRR